MNIKVTEEDKNLSWGFFIGGAYCITCTHSYIHPTDNHYALPGIITCLAYDIWQRWPFDRDTLERKPLDVVLLRICGASVLSMACRAIYLNPQIPATALAASGTLIGLDRAFAAYHRAHAIPLLSHKTLLQIVLGGSALSTVGLVSVELMDRQSSLYVGVIVVAMAVEVIRKRWMLKNEPPYVIFKACFRNIVKISLIALILCPLLKR